MKRWLILQPVVAMMASVISLLILGFGWIEYNSKSASPETFDFNKYILGISILCIVVLIASAVSAGINLKRKKVIPDLLMSNSELLRSIIDNTSSLIYIKDPEGKFLLTNKELESFLGVERNKIIGKTVYDFFPAEVANIYTRNDQKALHEKKIIEVEEDANLDGENYNFFSIKFPLLNKASKPYALVGVSTDITRVLQKKQVEKQRDITATTIDAQEKERVYIGRELHDSVSQLLASAKLMIESALSKPDETPHFLKLSKEAIVSAVNVVRDISHSLTAPSFPEENFTDSIEALVAEINASKKILINLRIFNKDALNLLNEKLQLSLYRILQEQLTNILKHSKANKAEIKISAEARSVTLSVSDNGIGGSDVNKTKGIGLKNISARVNFYSGEMNIKTAPGKGFELSVEIPVKEEVRK